MSNIQKYNANQNNYINNHYHYHLEQRKIYHPFYGLQAIYKL
jgi:hypothetical protein